MNQCFNSDFFFFGGGGEVVDVGGSWNLVEKLPLCPPHDQLLHSVKGIFLTTLAIEQFPLPLPAPLTPSPSPTHSDIYRLNYLTLMISTLVLVITDVDVSFMQGLTSR